jgi:hypothetical protein
MRMDEHPFLVAMPQHGDCRGLGAGACRGRYGDDRWPGRDVGSRGQAGGEVERVGERDGRELGSVEGAAAAYRDDRGNLVHTVGQQRTNGLRRRFGGDAWADQHREAGALQRGPRRPVQPQLHHDVIDD